MGDMNTARPTWLVPPILAAAIAIGVLAAPGDAQTGGRTITIAKGKETQTFSDVAPAGIKRGRVSLGDRLVATESLTIDGKPAGTMSSDATFVNRTPTTFARFKALLHVVWHFTDGDVYSIGYVDPQNGGDRETIIGGSGAYAGARGTVVGKEHVAVMTLE